MILQISGVLAQAHCAAIIETLSAERLWLDGAETAAGRAKAVKHNLQADPDAAPVRAAREMITRSILNHPILASAALPDRIVRLLFSRSDVGMGYGDHVDAPYMDGLRTDLSFTLFLSAPEAYDGGELVLEGPGAADSFKLPAGALVLYPSTVLHRVEMVRLGSRVVAAGWIRSRVRSAEARSAIFELDQTAQALESSGVAPAALDRLQNVKNNLIRLHGE